jgi:hypothetical protein
METGCMTVAGTRYVTRKGTFIVRRLPMKKRMRADLREINVGAKVIQHARYVVFRMAEVAIPRGSFRAILERIRQLRLPEAVPR